MSINRADGQILAYHVSNRRSGNAFKKLLKKISHLNIKQIHTDAYKAYDCMPKKYNRTIDKANTTRVESTNNLYRHFVPRFQRCTNNYSKTLEMIDLSISTMSRFINAGIRSYRDFLKIMSSDTAFDVSSLKLSLEK